MILFPVPGRPTPAQAEAGNYAKPTRDWHGLTIAIENPEGTVREGVDETGKPWRTVFKYAYGEFKGTCGVDGDPVDVYCGQHHEADAVYIIRQMKRKDWDKFDEDKVFVDFASMDDAKAAYLAHYDDPRFFGGIIAMPVDEFIIKVRATKKEPGMLKAVLFLKSHVKTYTREDGTVVAAHEDKRRAGWSGPHQSETRLTPDQTKILLIKKPKNVPGVTAENIAHVGNIKSQIRKVQAARNEAKPATQDPLVSASYKRAAVASAGLSGVALDAKRSGSTQPYTDAMNVDLQRKHKERRAAEQSKAERVVATYTEVPIAAAWSASFLERVKAAATDSAIHGYGEPRKEALLATLEAIARYAKKRGWKSDHTSGKDRASSRYIDTPRGIVRVSDHDLPMTAQREHNHSMGLTGRWIDEIVVADNWAEMSIDDYMNRLEHGSDWQDKVAKPLAKAMLFIKGHVGPYLRAGKLVNTQGYDGRPARAGGKIPGQMALFASKINLGPNPYKGKDPVASTSDMFDDALDEPPRVAADEHGEVPRGKLASPTSVKPTHSDHADDLARRSRDAIDRAATGDKRYAMYASEAKRLREAAARMDGMPAVVGMYNQAAARLEEWASRGQSESKPA